MGGENSIYRDTEAAIPIQSWPETPSSGVSEISTDTAAESVDNQTSRQAVANVSATENHLNRDTEKVEPVAFKPGFGTRSAIPSRSVPSLANAAKLKAGQPDTATAPYLLEPSPIKFVNMFESSGAPGKHDAFKLGKGAGISYNPMKGEAFIKGYEQAQSEVTGTQPQKQMTVLDSLGAGAVNAIKEETRSETMQPAPSGTNSAASFFAETLGEQAGKGLMLHGWGKLVMREGVLTAEHSGVNAGKPGGPNGDGGFLQGLAHGILYEGGHQIGYNSGIKPSTILDATTDRYHAGNFLGRVGTAIPFAVKDAAVNLVPGLPQTMDVLMSPVTDIPKYQNAGPIDPNAPPDMFWAGAAHGAAKGFNDLLGSSGYQPPAATHPLMSKYGVGEVLGTGAAYATAPVVYPVRKLMVEPMQSAGRKYHGQD